MDNVEMLAKLSNPLREAVEKIIKRSEKVGIEYKWEQVIDEDYHCVVYIPRGKGKHRSLVYDVEDAKKLLDLDFEKYVFVEGYRVAICCYEEGWVETVVESISPRISKTWILARVTGRHYDEVEKDMKAGKDIRLELDKGGGKDVRVLVGDPSKTLLGMSNYLEKKDALSVRVEGLRISNNMEAAEKLAQVTNSLFFELRKKRGVNFFVGRRYDVKISGWGRELRGKGKQKSEVGFPKFEYDKEPIELYWHAVSAYNMPLLQYLAYYQILEYYFVKYSMLEARKEIRNCLKDPEFDVDDDNDVVKIVASVSGKLGPRVSERDLLCDTIRGCISKEELAEELAEKALKEYFKNEYKVVSQFKVSQENKDIDIREQLAERIYDIRCKIVHTKEDDKRGRIMPFTKEEVLLREFELGVIENLVDKVLIANSRQLSL